MDSYWPQLSTQFSRLDQACGAQPTVTLGDTEVASTWTIMKPSYTLDCAIALREYILGAALGLQYSYGANNWLKWKVSTSLDAIFLHNNKWLVRPNYLLLLHIRHLEVSLERKGRMGLLTVWIPVSDATKWQRDLRQVMPSPCFHIFPPRNIKVTIPMLPALHEF